MVLARVSTGRLSTTYSCHVVDSPDDNFYEKAMYDSTKNICIPYVNNIANSVEFRSYNSTLYSVSSISNLSGYIAKGSGKVRIYFTRFCYSNSSDVAFSTSDSQCPYIEYTFENGELINVGYDPKLCMQNSNITAYIGPDYIYKIEIV